MLISDKDKYKQLPDHILAHAYDLLFGEEKVADIFKANEMRDILDEHLRIAKSIWLYAKCINYLQENIKIIDGDHDK